MKKAKITVLPRGKIIQVRTGSTFLSAVIAARVAIPNRCGGKGSCGTCKVKIESHAALSPVTPSEHRLISSEQLQEGYRLSCQCKVTGDSVLVIPESPLQRAIKRKLEANDK